MTLRPAADPGRRAEARAGSVRRRVRPADAPVAASHHSDPPLPRITIHVGEVAVSRDPAIMHTLLGSCVAVCLHDPVVCAGGINHIWLPDAREDVSVSRCGVHAMELLINELMAIGCDRRRLVAKAFGGANLFKASDASSVGLANMRFVREFLKTERIPLVSERLGGTTGIHLYFYTQNARARVKPLKKWNRASLEPEEQLQSPVLQNRYTPGEITLF